MPLLYECRVAEVRLWARLAKPGLTHYLVTIDATVDQHGTLVGSEIDRHGIWRQVAYSAQSYLSLRECLGDGFDRFECFDTPADILRTLSRRARDDSREQEFLTNLANDIDPPADPQEPAA